MAEKLDEKLAKIERGDNQLLRVFAELTEIGAQSYLSDILIIGALKRTLALSQGFRTHIRDKNFTCAGTLMRAQLDTALRVNALSLCSNCEDYARGVLEGKRVDKMKDRHGKRLTDSYLVEKLSEKYSWVTPLYDQLCEFGHLSNRHIFTGMTHSIPEQQVVFFQVTACDPPKPDSDYFGMVEGFYATMRVTGLISTAWYKAMRMMAAEHRTPPAA